MDMQFVFGNPKKCVASSKGHGTIKKERRISVKKSAKKLNPKKHAKGKRKNPARYKGLKEGRLPKYTGIFPTPSEAGSIKSELSALRKQFSSIAGQKIPRKQGETNKQYAVKTRAKKRKLAPLKLKSKKIFHALRAGKKAYLSAKQMKDEMVKQGYRVVPELTKGISKKIKKGVRPMAKKTRKTKKTKKTKKTRKLTKKQLRALRLRNLAKGRKVLRSKKGTRKAVRSTRKSRRIRKAYRTLKPHRTIRFKIKQKGTKRAVKFSLRRLNPMGNMVAKIESKIGIPLAELGGLAVGGALYGMVNKMFLKIPGLNTAWASALKIKYVGSIIVPAVPNLALGIAASIIGRSKKIKVLEDIGHGMIGSAVVGMGVSSSQELFGGLLGVSGVQYTPLNGIPAGMRGIPAGLGEENVDDYQPQMGNGADFGGVEFTPMNGVDYTPNMSGADFDGANPDFNGIPEGLGEGQMG